jgi:acyl transferase domain-containing protein
MASPHGNKQDSEPIAIVGYAYRAPNVGRKHLWEFLAEAKSAFSSVPPDRFQHEAFYHPNPEKAGCISSKGGHFLPEDIYAFDAPFFSMTADEAEAIDPQHRLLLECAFEAAESAGLPLNQLAGSR